MKHRAPLPLVPQSDLAVAAVGVYLVGRVERGELVPVIDCAEQVYDIEADAIMDQCERVLVARVRRGGLPRPKGLASFTVRPDGCEVLTQWVPT